MHVALLLFPHSLHSFAVITFTKCSFLYRRHTKNANDNISRNMYHLYDVIYHWVVHIVSFYCIFLTLAHPHTLLLSAICYRVEKCTNFKPYSPCHFHIAVWKCSTLFFLFACCCCCCRKFPISNKWLIFMAFSLTLIFIALLHPLDYTFAWNAHTAATAL